MKGLGALWGKSDKLDKLDKLDKSDKSDKPEKLVKLDESVGQSAEVFVIFVIFLRNHPIMCYLLSLVHVILGQGITGRIMSSGNRVPLVAGNWKMYKKLADAIELVNNLDAQIADVQGVEVVVCPPFTAINSVTQALEGSAIAVGGQNCYHEEQGAFTGEIAPQMLLDAGCTWVIIGHSERRKIFGEGDAFLNRKLKYALSCGLKVMFCIGETLEEREGGTMEAVLTTQVKEGLAGLAEGDFAKIALAYEPVWAIGTGVTASPLQAEEAHAFVRGLVAKEFGAGVAEALRIQYGGSVKPGNAAELYSNENVDGFLVGGASLEAESFAGIIKAVV